MAVTLRYGVTDYSKSPSVFSVTKLHYLSREKAEQWNAVFGNKYASYEEGIQLELFRKTLIMDDPPQP